VHLNIFTFKGHVQQMINHSPYVNVIIDVGILEEGGLEGKNVSIACSVHALHSSTVQKNIPLLCAEYEKCECVRMVCIMFFDSEHLLCHRVA
jgi:hypothetical protein